MAKKIQGRWAKTFSLISSYGQMKNEDLCVCMYGCVFMCMPVFGLVFYYCLFHVDITITSDKPNTFFEYYSTGADLQHLPTGGF